MSISVVARLRVEVSDKFAAALKPDARVDLGDSFYCALDDGGEAFFRAYAKLRAAGNDFFNPLVDVCNDDPKVFPEDRKKHLIGFLAESLDQLSLLNPAEDFRRPPLGPLPSGLKEEAEMDLDRRPTGLFVCVADEYIAHDDWLEHFASKAVTGVKPVRCKGKVAAGWNRLKVLKRKPILDEMCFAWISSAMSGRPLIKDYGDVWLSTTEEPVTETVVNDRGRGEYGECPCYILSDEALRRFRKVHRLQRAGLRPLAVYSPKSKRYEIIKKIDARLAHLRKVALKELKTAKPSKVTKEAMEELRRFMKAFFGH